LAVTPEVEIWRRPKKINFLTLVSYSLLQTVFRSDVPFCHNTKRHRRQMTDDRQTDKQTTQCTKGSTDSMVSQKPDTRLNYFLADRKVK